MKIRFDDSLPALVALVSSRVGTDTVERCAFIRDAGGHLSVVVPSALGTAEIEKAEADIRRALGGYARPERVLLTIDAPGAKRLLQEASRQPATMISNVPVRLLDRRIVGADWLTPPV